MSDFPDHDRAIPRIPRPRQPPEPRPGHDRRPPRTLHIPAETAHRLIKTLTSGAGRLAHRLTCDETDALASLLIRLDATDQALTWLDNHTQSPGCTDH